MPASGILLAHDFSERSEQAAQRAFQMAQDSGETVHAVHVVDEAFAERKWLGDDSGESDESVIERLRGSVQERLRTELEPLASPYGVTLEAHAALGYVAEQLAALSERYDCRLLVIGARGRHAIRDLLLGATAEQLLWYMEAPTLVVRSDDVSAYERVLVAVDFSEASEHAMRTVAEWFPKAQVRLVHVIDSRALERLADAGLQDDVIQDEWDQQDSIVTDYLEAMMGRTGLGGERVEARIVHGHPVEALAEQVGEFQADLAVMGGQGRSRLTRWLPGRVSSRLVHQLPCDVLLAR